MSAPVERVLGGLRPLGPDDRAYARRVREQRELAALARWHERRRLRLEARR